MTFQMWVLSIFCKLMECEQWLQIWGKMVLNWVFLILLWFVNGELNPHGDEGLIATVTGPELLCHNSIARKGFKDLMRNLFVLFFLLVLTEAEGNCEMPLFSIIPTPH